MLYYTPYSASIFFDTDAAEVLWSACSSSLFHGLISESILLRGNSSHVRTSLVYILLCKVHQYLRDARRAWLSRNCSLVFNHCSAFTSLHPFSFSILFMHCHTASASIFYGNW